MITGITENFKGQSDKPVVFTPVEANEMSPSKPSETKVAKIRDGMVFLSARLKPGKPTIKNLEKARKLPPFLIRVF